MDLLFVCTESPLRSPTAEASFSAYPGVEAIKTVTPFHSGPRSVPFRGSEDRPIRYRAAGRSPAGTFKLSLTPFPCTESLRSRLEPPCPCPFPRARMRVSPMTRPACSVTGWKGAVDSPAGAAGCSWLSLPTLPSVGSARRIANTFGRRLVTPTNIRSLTSNRLPMMQASPANMPFVIFSPRNHAPHSIPNNGIRYVTV